MHIIVIKLFKSNKKEKILKTAREKRHVTNRKNNDKDDRNFLTGNKSSDKKKKMSTHNSILN